MLNKAAYAKINLTLDVLNKRGDGYHNIISIMQSIDLCDFVSLEKSRAGISVDWNLKEPVDHQNTAYRAAKLMIEKYNLSGGINISIDKRIPVSAGLGGGSADAAAVIEGINELFELGLKSTELMNAGVEIGADVPFCLHRGTAVAKGIGEILTRIDSEMECHAVLVKPPISVSTKDTYEKIDSLSLPRLPGTHLTMEAMMANDLKNLGQNLCNVLELITSVEYPIINRLKQKLAALGASGALMSGSGPTVYGLFGNRIQAENACAYFKNISGLEVFTCEFYYPKKC